MKSVEELENDVLAAAQAVAQARKDYAEAFLLAKVRTKGVTDGQAQQQAEVAGAEALELAQARLFVARLKYDAGLRLAVEGVI